MRVKVKSLNSDTSIGGKFKNNARGAVVVEYSLIAGLVALTLVGSISNVGSNIAAKLDALSNAAQNGGSGPAFAGSQPIAAPTAPVPTAPIPSRPPMMGQQASPSN